MANWCWNNVHFTGKQKNLEKLSQLIDKTIEMVEKTGQGQILFGLEGSLDGYMFDISNEDLGEDYLVLSFQSRWAPIPNDIVRIAELFNLEFTYDYEESGMGLFGKYTFKIIDEESTILYDQSASEEDIKSCQYKLEGDEDDEETGFNYDKLETIIEDAPMMVIPTLKINER
jgi:hypothetical protein